jgi:hypothetical protein
MPRRLLLLSLLVLVVLPGPAFAAKPPAAKLKDPTVSWVRIGALDNGSVVVRIRVRHAPLGSPAPAVRTIGAVTVVLSRFQRDRNFSVGGGTAARALPILEGPLGVVYRMTLSPGQSAAVKRASAAGTLRALVLVDQRAQATGRSPVRSGTFQQSDAKVLALGATEPPAAPPLLAKGERTRVAIGTKDNGRPVVDQVVLPLPGGRSIVLAPRVGVDVTGAPTNLTGTVRVVASDGKVIGETSAPAGFTLAVQPSKGERGTLIWPAFEVPNVEPIPAGSAVLSPPPTRAGSR